MKIKEFEIKIEYNKNRDNVRAIETLSKREYAKKYAEKRSKDNVDLARVTIALYHGTKDIYAKMGKNVTIGTNCRIDVKTAIGKNSTIGNNCRIINSTIGNNVTIADNSTIINSKIGDHVSMGNHAGIYHSEIEENCKFANYCNISNRRLHSINIKENNVTINKTGIYKNNNHEFNILWSLENVGINVGIVKHYGMTG